MENAKESLVLIGAIMSIVQPELYHTGHQALEKLFNEPGLVGKHIELLDALEAWWIPFSAMTVVSNRETPLHRDMGGRVDWSDMLIALGQYEHSRLITRPRAHISLQPGHRRGVLWNGFRAWRDLPGKPSVHCIVHEEQCH